MARWGLVSLQRLLSLISHRRFVRSLYPRDPTVIRGIEVLRVHDAIGQGASQREIASILFGRERVSAEWNGPSDSLRSRVRRLVREARAMAGGRYRELMRRAARVRGEQAQS
ncbi:DNA -binding domain-containing protein [Novosphingobium rhizovicinum]